MSRPYADSQSQTEQPLWQCPQPRQLPELRGKLASWLTERGAGFYLEALLVGSQQIRPPGPLPVAAEWLADAERRRVTDGELFWVSAEMTDLAHHAGRQLTRHELYEHDLPSRSGFMVFQTPMATTTTSFEGVELEVVAVSWEILSPRLPPLLARHGPVEEPVGADWTQGAVWFTFYSHPHSFVEANLSRYGNAVVDELRQLGPFMPDNELLWALDQLVEPPDGDEVTSAWGKTVIAAWLLMQQPLTSHSAEAAPRPARRRLQRADLPTGDVQLLHVRRPQRRPTTPRSEPGDRQYSVRWWVDGHWRRYHCGPGRQRIERRWILTYLAGPDDKPIQGTQRVKIWDR